jgi:hypothetical protein
MLAQAGPPPLQGRQKLMASAFGDHLGQLHRQGLAARTPSRNCGYQQRHAEIGKLPG